MGAVSAFSMCFITVRTGFTPVTNICMYVCMYVYTVH